MHKLARRRLVRVCCGLGLVSVVLLLAHESGLAQRKQSGNRTAAAAAAPKNASLAAGSFSAKGLNNEKVLTSLYLGDFVSIPFDRDNINFGTLYSAYLSSYAQRCVSRPPPANFVEMTREVCETERVTRNGYGMEISRYCVEYRTEGTNQYADPEMYAAKKALDRHQAADVGRSVLGMLTQGDPLAGAMNMLGNTQAAISDMADLVQMNACKSPGLKRFQENLRLFALNKQPIRLGAQAPESPASTRPPGSPFKDQNYTRLVDDLIIEQSKSWVMNRYASGSVSGVSVLSRDNLGRPSKISAQYVYAGFSGRSAGSVSLTFADGIPECMYFFDYPATCRTPNRKIAYAYADGTYQR